MENTNFIAFDFETATHNQFPCQIGIIVVKNGQITERICRLIQPPGNRYDVKFTRIHGITPDMTINEPTFELVWMEIQKYFMANFLVAHNFKFDFSVLDKILNYYGLDFPPVMGYACTYEIFGKKLKESCKDYDITLNNHHDALCDAEACCELFLKYLGGCEVKKVEKVSSKSNSDGLGYAISIDLGSILDNDDNDSPNISQWSPFLQEEININDISTDDRYLGKGVIITGETPYNRSNAYEVLRQLGAIDKTGISKNVNYVIIGDEPGYSKLEKTQKLIDAGHDIIMVDALDFQKEIQQIVEEQLNRKNQI